jgi:hypothetical protein
VRAVHVYLRDTVNCVADEVRGICGVESQTRCKVIRSK